MSWPARESRRVLGRRSRWQTSPRQIAHDDRASGRSGVGSKRTRGRTGRRLQRRGRAARRRAPARARLPGIAGRGAGVVSEERTLLTGTAANVAGLIVGIAAALGVQILLGRGLEPGGFGLVTVAVQVAFVASAGSRFGMDMAAVRLVAIGRGAEATSHLRSLVDRCALVALGASIVVAALVAASAPLYGDYATPVAIAAIGIPFIALTNVYLGATRGLDPDAPDALRLLDRSTVALDRPRGGSDRRRSRHQLRRLRVRRLLGRRRARGTVRFGAGTRTSTATGRQHGKRFGPRSGMGSRGLRPRCSRRPSSGSTSGCSPRSSSGTELDAYAAAARVSQVLLLFLTSLNLVFSPFAADLHARGERERLGELFKRSARAGLSPRLSRS